MCDLSKGVREEGRAEGRAEGRVEGLSEGRIEMATDNVRSLMKEMKITLNEAIKILKINETIRPEVERAIKATN